MRKVWGGDCIVTKLKPTEAEQEKVREAVGKYDTIVLGTCNAILYEEQAKLANFLLAQTGKTVIVVAMDSPYDIEVMPTVGNYICTYGAVAASMQAAVEVMTGALKGDAVPSVTIRS